METVQTEHHSPPRRIQTSGKKTVAAERRDQVLRLRRSGMQYRDIAKVVGISSSRAYEIVKSELEHIRNECAETARELRDMQLQSLQEMLAELDKPEPVVEPAVPVSSPSTP